MYAKKSGSASPKREDLQKRARNQNSSNHAERLDPKSKRYSLEAGPPESGRGFRLDDYCHDVSTPVEHYHTVSGANAKYLKDALSKNIHLQSVSEDGSSGSCPSVKRQGLFSKHLSVSPRSGHGSSPVREKHRGKMKQFFGSLRNRTKSMSSESSVKDHPEIQHDSSLDGSLWHHRPRFSVTSPEGRENEIGPNEYIQMYRERALSDCGRLAAARQAAKDKKMGSMNRSFQSGIRGGGGGGDDDDDGSELHYLVWRDKGDTTIYKLPTAPCDAFGDDDDVFSQVGACFARFFNEHTCYDLIPNSSKIVVFDTRLTVKKAFSGLVTNGVKAGILWDTQVQNFTGMLTVTDFIKILDMYHSSSEVNLENLENDSISKWKSMLEPHSLVQCSPEDKLFHALQLLTTNKVHRLLVIDRKLGNPVNVLTHKRMLNFLQMHMHNLLEPSFLFDSIATLGIGTFNDLATITFDTKLIEAVKLFLEFGVSAVPVVDGSNKPVGILSKFDFSRLAYDKLYNNLDLPVREILPTKPEEFSHMHTCRPRDTLKSAIKKIVSASVHRLIVVEEDGSLAGMLSLSDILKCLVFRPLEKDSDSAEDEVLGKMGSLNMQMESLGGDDDND